MMKARERWLAAASAIIAFGYFFWLTPGYWNLGFSLLNTVFLAVVLLRMKKLGRSRVAMFTWGGSLVLGWFLSLRNFEFVRLLTVAGVFILNVLTVVMAKKPKAKMDIGRLMGVVVGAIGGIPASLKRTIGLVAKTKMQKKWLSVGAGIIVSIPLLIVFVALFSSADPMFAKIMEQIKLPEIRIDSQLIFNIMSSIFMFGVTLSIFRNKWPKREINKNILKQITETNVAIAIVEVVFLLFAAVQIRWLVADAGTLRSMGIVLSEYTRRGYGEMIAASILAYGLVIWLEYAIRSQKKLGIKEVGISQLLAATIIVEIFIFIIGATKRNFLYQDAYGFTQIRLLGFFLSGWLVAMLLVMAFKIAKNKGVDFFVRSIVVVTTVAVISMNLFDIDGMIARSKPANLGYEIDYKYLANLSADGYIGWKIGVDYVEKKIAEGVNNRNDYYKLDEIIAAMNRHKYQLKRMTAGNWSTGGSWNLGSAQAWSYLEADEKRLIKIRKDLDEIDQRLSIQKRLEETKKEIIIQNQNKEIQIIEIKKETIN